MRGCQMKIGIRLLALAALLWGPGRLDAAEGTTSGTFLEESFGERPRAMGQAYVAVSDDIFGLAYNPAGLSQLHKAQVAAEYAPDILDQKMGFFGLAMPLTQNHVLGLTFSFLDAGTIEISDADGNVVRSAKAQSDQLFHIGYGYAWRKLPFSLRGNLHLGAGAKLLRSSIVDEVKAQTFAADLGALYARALPGLGLGRLGFSISNIGPGLRYSGGKASGGESDPLSRTMRIGASYQKSLPRSDSLTVSAELDRRPQNQTTTPSFGLEYLHHGLLAFRVGYRKEADAQPISLGFGINWRDIGVDYSLSLLQTFGNLHRISLSYSFQIPWVEPKNLPGEAPFELLSRQLEKDIAEGRYFHAQENVLKLLDLFPNNSAVLKYNEDIQGWVLSTFRQGILAPRFQYANAHAAYYEKNWPMAAERLRLALQAEPNNEEIQRFLEVAEGKVKELRELEKLKKDARISYLFELANKAYLAGNYEKAIKIFDEILRISNYQPAIRLRQDIERQLKKAPAKKPAVPVRAPAPAKGQAPPAPAVPPVRQAEKAEGLYFSAIRKYSEGDLAATISILKEAKKLDPESQEIQSTLQRAEKEWEESRKEQKEFKP